MEIVASHANGNPSVKWLRPAEELVRDSELLVEGSPSIHLLQAVERATSNKELRWFDLGEPSSTSERPHKVVILIGSIGSGKSTLIDAMVNYILGVEWEDPFRFRLIQEDYPTDQVTAYTMHHFEGMKIDYDVTIIDIPGYDDTIKNRAITCTIGNFLSHLEPQSDLKSIHSVCLVASSPDSLISPATAQRFVDSFVSLFDRDAADNLRLLVTFSDETKPPSWRPLSDSVATANITGDSSNIRRIQHHKFNNSVLYASNVDGGGDEFLFKKSYWNFNHKNFSEFFSMLANVPQLSLKHTLAVFKSRLDLEISLEEIETQLEITLDKIEEIHTFQKELAEVGNQMVQKKPLEMVYRDWVPHKTPLGNYRRAYNCNKCRATCGGVHALGSLDWIKKNRPDLIKCKREVCKCSKQDHDLQDFKWEMRQIEKKVLTSSSPALNAELEFQRCCKMSVQQMQVSRKGELKAAKQKGVALLKKMSDCLNRSNKKSTVADHVRVMKMRAEQEKRPGWATRNKILDELLAQNIRRVQ